MAVGFGVEKIGSNTMNWTADRRLYLSPDRTQVCEQEAVERGCHPSHTLLVGKGQRVPDATVQRYGLGSLPAQAEALADTPDASVADPSTDTGAEEQGSQNGSQDAENAPEPEIDPETKGLCCPHALKHHRRADGACSYRKSCNCQGWAADEPDPDPDGHLTNPDLPAPNGPQRKR